jgi:hypothetical protein
MTVDFKRSVLLSLALTLGPAPALAQGAPPPGALPPAPGAPPPAFAPSAQQRALMRQAHAQLEAFRLQTRVRILAALTPQHRATVATLAGQLVLSANPDPRAAAQALDAVLSPAEKQSILVISAAQRASMRAFMQQQRATFSAGLSPDQRAEMARREAERQAYVQSHPRPARVEDAGKVVLRTLGDFGPPGTRGEARQPF